MSDLTASHLSLLRHLNDGGIAELRVYGKRVITQEVICQPKSYGAGLKSLSYLKDLGLVDFNDPIPYKSGKSFPIVLTDAGKLTLKITPDTECDTCDISPEGHEYDCPNAQE